MLRNVSLNLKMLVPSVVLCCVIAATGWIGWRALNEVTNRYDRVSSVSLPRKTAVDEMFLSFRRIRITLRTLALRGLSEKGGEENIEEAIKETEKVDRLLSEYSKIPFEEGEKEKFENVKAAWSTFKVLGAEVIKTYRGHEAGRIEKLEEIFLTSCPANAKVFTDAIHDLSDFHELNAELWREQASHGAQIATRTITITVIVGMSLGLLLTIFTLRSVSGLIKGITAIVRNLETSASKVGEVSEDVAQTSGKLSANSTQQAAALQQTTAALEETSSMVQKNSDSAKRSAEVSTAGRASAERGQAAVGEVVESMNDISQSNEAILRAVEQSNRDISDIIKVINEIGTKTRVINDIVFQTKLLSFNASVEAARAGEHGKGFAVVAQEVGALAEMSGNASKEITALLDSSVNHVKSVVDKMKENIERLVIEGSKKVESGSQTAQRCATVLGEIVGQISEVNSMASDISASSQEQSRGIQEINAAITQLDTAAQENASASERVSGSASELREQVAELRTLVQNLNGLVKGGAAAPAHASPTVLRNADSHEAHSEAA